MELVCGMELHTILKSSVKGKLNQILFILTILYLNYQIHSNIQYQIILINCRYNLKFVQKDSESDRNERALSETTDPESETEEDFVEALDSLDLTERQNMQLYTSFLEPLVNSVETP